MASVARALNVQSVHTAVHAQLPPHFQDAQRSLASHRKNTVSLFRLHAAAARVTEQTDRGTRLVGEKVFNECFLQCLDRVLALKKGVSNADRACKFVAAYIACASLGFCRCLHADAQERFRAARASPHDGEEVSESEGEPEDTTGSRFATILLKHLLKGFLAKNKSVRLRCCGCVALLINGVESLDDDIYTTLTRFLHDRLSDREPSVRVQAVIALARLQMDEEDDNGSTQMLLRLLRYDPSADVRRAALFNITPSASTLPYILERLQDVDATNRRCVYQGSLKMLLQAQPLCDENGRVVAESLGLSEARIAEVVRVGLHERDETVRRAARKLTALWLEACGHDWLLLLRYLHVSTSECGEPVVMALLEDRADAAMQVAALLRDQDTFWRAMTPEKAVLAKCFVAYCKRHELEARLEECIPLVTALAFHIQAGYEQLSDLLEQQATEELQDDMPAIQDESSVARIFVVNELLAVAMHCDYGDELGRRKMFTLVRDMLSNAWLPVQLIPRCLDVLLCVSNDQRDFVQMVVEFAQELDAEPAHDEDGSAARDEGDEEDDAADTSVRDSLSWQTRLATGASSEPHQAALETRRLLIVRAMLERVASTLQDNTAFHGLIPQLIVPAVRSKDASVREEGLICLGLCSLLDERMALDTFALFLDQIQRAAGTIRVRCIESLFDLLLVHGMDVLCSRSAEAAANADFDGDEQKGLAFARQQLLSFLLSLLEHDDADVQACAAQGFAKLLLTGAFVEEDVLKSLVLIYMSPDTASNQPLRQCLSYFIPLFCSSHAHHQRILERVFIDTFDVLAQVYDEKDDGTAMATPAQVALQLADWSNPEKLLLSEPDEAVHLDLAGAVLKHLCTIITKEHRKALLQVLGKLYLPSSADATTIKSLSLLVHAVQQRAVHDDAPMRNQLQRFDQALEKRYDGSLGDPGLAELAAFLQGLPEPSKVAERAKPAPRARARSRKIESSSEEEAESTSDESEDTHAGDEVAASMQVARAPPALADAEGGSSDELDAW